MSYELGSIVEEVEYGLRTPDGTIIWPPDQFLGHPIDTETDRNALPEALRAHAVELKINHDAFLGSYQWVPRTRTTTVVYKLDDDVLFGPQTPAEPQAPTPNDGEPEPPVSV